MAKRKATVPQKDFSLGEVRPDALERNDVEILDRSLQKAENALLLATGAIEGRPGSFYLATVNGDDGAEIEPGDGVVFNLIIVPGGLELYTEDGDLHESFSGAPWVAGEDVWITPAGDVTLMGSQESPPHVLTYEDGVFTFGEMAFSSGPGDEIRQPYWPHERGVLITPSARTGNITITASEGVFHSGYVGERIRYVDREIEITAVNSPTEAEGTVKQELHETIRLSVDSTTGFAAEEAVEHETLGGQGIIAQVVDATNLDILVTEIFGGFAQLGENLIGPNAKTNITAITSAPSISGTSLWDEPLMSSFRGYPGSCAHHGGRLVFCDFPQAPHVIALSASGTLDDFKIGPDDSDAILDIIGISKSTRVLHAVSAEDLILLTSRGSYYQQTRDRTPLTPANWDPVKFDDIGASRIRPVKVFDGIVFLASNGKNLMGALLQSGFQKPWGIEALSDFHSHLMKTPVRIGATTNDSDRPERFVFVANDDGSAVVMRWDRTGSRENDVVGFVPWTTAGSYKSFYMAFGSIHAIVARTIDGVTSNFLERMDANAFLDAASGFATTLSTIVDEDGFLLVDEDGFALAGETGSAKHLANHTASVFLADWDFGDHDIDAEGFPLDDNGQRLTFPTREEEVQVGLNFETTLKPWSRRHVEGYNKRREAQRIVRLTVAVRDTTRIKVNGEQWGDYRIGEELADPPPRRTEHAHFYVLSRGHYQDIPVVKARPGPFTVTAMYYKVTL